MIPVHSQPIRVIAIFEALKGALVILAGLGLLSVMHRDLQHFAEHLIELLHLNPGNHFSEAFVRSAERIGGMRMVVVVGVAMGYAAVRFIEAYGLWKERAWAEWFAAASGAIYIPFEIRHVVSGRHAYFALAALAVNLAVVGVMVYALLARRRTRKAGPPPTS
jgi:uncharacterized membrane protein (DUF2068 family)